MTTQSTSPWPMSTRVAPSATRRSTSASWSAGSVGATSRCSRFLPSFGATGGPPQVIIGPVPSGARIAVSSSWSQTSAQPSAALQKCPTSLVPSPLIAPSRPQSARNELVGSITQSSLPSGSASTTWPSSGRCPMSMCRAPSSTSLATESRWSSRDVVVRSRWNRLGPTFGSGTGTKSSRNRVPSVGSTLIPSPSPSATSQRSASAQKRASPTGSFASTQRATSRRAIPLPSVARSGRRAPASSSCRSS